MAYYSVVKQCLTSLRSGANVLDELKEQIEKERKADELFAQRLFYYETKDGPTRRFKRTAMSPPPTMEQLTQWRMDWMTYQELRTKSRQRINTWSNQLDGLTDWVRKHVGEDVDRKRTAPRRTQSRGVRRTTRKASVASDSTSDDDEESSDGVAAFRCLRFRQLLRFPLALRPINTAYYNLAMATIQEYDVDLMVILAASRMEDPIEGEEKWPPWWKRSPELCCWITQDVVEWLAQIPEEVKSDVAEMGIEISESEGDVTRTLADDAATHIMVDSGDRLDRFRGPRF